MQHHLPEGFVFCRDMLAVARAESTSIYYLSAILIIYMVLDVGL